MNENNMKRLIFTGIFLIFGVSLLFGQEKRQPNIIFIMADDLGYGDLGVYGQKHIETPHIDLMAEKGLKFNEFYAGTSVCAPSRSALMTGQHTGHTYIRGNKEIVPEGQEPLADSVRTVAMLLQKAGYKTGAFGKWGLGMVGTSGDPNLKGFDQFYGYNCQRQSHRYYPTHIWDNSTKVVLNNGSIKQRGEDYAAALIHQKSLEFLDENHDRPFFLFIPTVLPHAELVQPEDEFYRKYADRFEETPHKGNDYGPRASVPGYSSVEKPRASYAAMVSRMDAYVGEVIQKVKDLGIEDNTLIMFTSDNGPHREGGNDPEFFDSSGGLRGIKRQLYEGGIRVPFVAYWPGQIQAGRQSNLPAAFWDILPTFADLANTEVDSYTDGISFAPTLFNKGKQAKHQYLYWEFHEDGGRQAVRAGKWKLVKQNVSNPEKTTFELYNLKKDPGETRDLLNKRPRVFKRLNAYIDQARVRSEIFPLMPEEKN